MTINHNVPADQAELEALGIVRVPAEVYLWSDYRDSDVGDAIAAAKRGGKR